MLKRLIFWLLFFSCSAFAQHTEVVKRVVDGDTLLLASGTRVRLIGVDTPESVRPNTPVQYFAKEASAFTRRMVEGKRVKLESEWPRKDMYGRGLAYVFLEDGTFLNAEIIKQGYGFAYTRFPFKYLEDFRRYEREAREGNKGLWGDDSKASQLSSARAPSGGPGSVRAAQVKAKR